MTVAALESVLQHGPVYLIKNVVANLDDEVRTHTENVAVERGMVQLAKGQAVGNRRFTFRMAIGEDVRAVEQLPMTKTANCARFSVRPEHSCAKAMLMKSLLR